MPEETPDNKQINDLLQKQKMTFGELVEKWRGRKRARKRVMFAALGSWQCRSGAEADVMVSSRCSPSIIRMFSDQSDLDHTSWTILRP
jgi:hypothetical protein